MKNRIVILFLIIGCYNQLFAQQHARGGIEGIVINVEDSRPVVGANVLLQGTVLGTVTDREGNFKLKNIPVGKYNLTVSMIGFKRKEMFLEIVSGEIKRISIELIPTPIQTEPVIITASKREQSLEEVPISVSIIDNQTLTLRNTITIDEALQYVPGVNINRSQVNIRGSTGYSYGVGTRVLLLVDGLPFLTGDTDEIIWESIPTSQIDRVEVVKGAGSALYGSSALGGVINVITRSVFDVPETKFRVYGGLYDRPKYSTWRWTSESRTFSGIHANHLQPIGDLKLGVGVSRTLDDGYKRNDDWKRWNLWTRIGYNLSAYQSAALSFSLLDQRRGSFLYWKDLDHALEPTDNQLGNRVKSLRYNLSGSYKKFFSDKFYSILKLSWFRSRWEDNIPSSTYPAGTNSRSDFLIGEIQTNYQLSERHFLIGGISGNYNNALAQSIFGKHHALGGAFYLQDEVKYDESIRFTIGGRLDYQKLEGMKDVSQVNPKFGIVYNPALSTTLRASVGRGFRAPSVAEVFTSTDAGGLIIRPNPSLKSERSWSYEIGGSQILSDNFLTDLSFFRNEFWDLIEPVSDNEGIVRFKNITRARITGVEAILNVFAINRLLQSQVSYTFVYPEDVSNKSILNHRSRHLFYVTNKISVEPVNVGMDFRYISKMERLDSLLQNIIRDANQRVAAYVVDLHFGVDWKFSGLALTTAFHVNNVLQYYYTDFIGYLAPLRNYVLTIETRL